MAEQQHHRTRIMARLERSQGWQRWLGAALAVTVLFGICYVVVQQCWRMGANEPQRSMVEDTAYVLQHGGRPGLWADGKASVDMAYSMAPFIIIYDKAGNVVGGNGYLNGQIPKPPAGVLEYADRKGENRVTWQPQKGVRVASITRAAGNYYILGGRSLAVVEARVAKVAQWLFALWAFTMLGIFVYYNATRAPKRK